MPNKEDPHIKINCVLKWMSFYGVPDFEVYRCKLLKKPMRIRHLKEGKLYNEIIIPVHRLDEGEKTGIFKNKRMGTSWIKYQVINFKIHDYENPED